MYIMYSSMFYKVGRIFPMVISSEFHVRQYRDDDHQEDEPHFIIDQSLARLDQIPVLHISSVFNEPYFHFFKILLKMGKL